MCTSGLGDCTPYTTTCTIVVRLHTSPHSSLIARTATSSGYHHPRSSDCSKSTSPIGPPYLSVDAPTISKCRSEPPTIRAFSPITPETPTRNPSSECQPLSTFSPHSYLSSPTSIAPPSPAQFRLRRGPRLVLRPCDLRHTRRIQCKRDGYDDGEELTRARVKD